MVNDREDKILFPAHIKLHAACVLPDGQMIATRGGNLPSSAFRYQASSGWTYISDLLFTRTGHFMVFHKGTVYVIGGIHQERLIREVERLNTDDL